MQNNHKPQHIYTEKVFKIISSLFLSNLKIQFSDRHNSLYGYSDFLARLFDMCRHGQYAETAYNSRFIKVYTQIPSVSRRDYAECYVFLCLCSYWT